VRSVRVLVCVAAVTVGLAACGGGDDSSGSVNRGGGSTTTTPTTAAPATTTPGSKAADAFVGLTKQAAIAKAEREGRPWRIGREDDEQFALTQDYIENRVTFEIDDGKVTQATFG
jgi:hypothetical protein